MSEHVALYPGTFDPVTHGHLDLVRRGAGIFDALIVAVSTASGRTHFTLDERLGMLEAQVAPYENVSIQSFDGLLVEFARRVGATVLLRGVRGVRDYEYELEMAWANRGLAPELETVFLAPSPQVALVSSSLVREVASLGGDVSAWVAPAVVAALAARPPAGPGADGARKEE
jgi:pantetheine-phosphate adenylyltransferase